MSPKTKRRLLRSATALLILGVLVWWSHTSHTELDRYKAKLIAQGEILDLDKLAPQRTGYEPDGDEPMRQTVRQMTNDLVPRSLWFRFTTTNGVQQFEWHPMAGQHSNILTRIQNGIAEIESKRPGLLILHQGLTNMPADKGADYRHILNYPQVNFVQRRTISQFLHHAIVLDAYAGRYGDAFTNLITSLRMAQHHREEWTLENQMVRTTMVKLPLEDLNYGLALHAWDDVQLAELHTQIASISLVTNVYQALLYERARGLAFFAEGRQNAQSAVNNAYFVVRPVVDLKQRIHTVLWSKFAINEDELNFLKLSQQRLDLIRPNLRSPNWTGVPEQLRKDMETIYLPATAYPSQLKLTLTHMLYSSMDRGFPNLLFAEARRQQALAAIALERHWLKHGHYPDTLDKLIPDYLPQVPSDPINGRPLRYRVNPDGTYTLWSIGMDGKDDGGDPTIPASKRQEPQEARDLVWPRINPLDLPPKP